MLCCGTLGMVLQESRACAKPFRSLLRILIRSNGGYAMYITVVRDHGCGCCISWPAGSPDTPGGGPTLGGPLPYHRPLACDLRSWWPEGIAGGVRPGWEARVPAPRRPGRPGAGPPAAGRHCFLRGLALVGEGALLRGGQLSHALHHRPHPVQGEA
jgi:hypothetical protein